MTAPLNDRVEEALAQLRRDQEEIRRVSERAANATGATAAAKDRSLSVAVDSQGALTGITFHGQKFRKMAPAELASLIVETARAARTEATAAMVELFQPLFPGGFDLSEMMGGTFDLDAMFDDAVRQARRDDLPGGPVTVGGGNE
jgi:hypothetical protein